MTLFDYPQFILYKLVPSIRPGKTDKLPVDYRTASVNDAHDPAIWTDYQTARTIATTFGQGYGVGFVFTANDPFWFLDIDDCRQADGSWSQLAVELCNTLAGAFVEVSQSGKGLHIIGSGTPPAHGCRNQTFALEFYHTARFVALGYTDQAHGNTEFDASHILPGLVERFFPPSAGDGVPATWTTTPVPAWNGPIDDDDLIRRACRSRSASGAFGGKASFAELWDADPVALAAAYPDPTGERNYDASSADAALAQHLAFWTGSDCARMQRLMLRSALVREKWQREDYIPRTILSAVGRQQQWCNDTPTTAPTTASATAHSSAPVAGEARQINGWFLGAAEMQTMFAGCVYVRDAHKVMMPDGELISQGQLDVWCGGYQYSMDKTNEKTTKSAWEAFTCNQHTKFPKVHSCAFRPAMTPGAIWSEGVRTLVNTYFPIATECTPGDVTPFLDHLKRLLPVERDREIFLAYMAALLQHPGVKFQWAPLLQGVPGNGKSLFSTCMIEAVGRAYSYVPKAEQLTGKFNDWIERRLLITVEDVYVPEHKADVLEALKPMITSSLLEIEGKGRDRVTREICANFILNSNHKDAVRKTKEDRRFAVFYTAQQTPEDIERDSMGGDYFPRMYAWLRSGGFAAVNAFLRAYQIPDELNPAGACHRAPKTSSTEEAIHASMGSIEQEVMHAIDQDRPGFRGGWISTHFLDLLIKEIGAERRIPRNRRREMLRTLGYVPHPGLQDGRVNNAVQPDGPGAKPRLYVLVGDPVADLKGPATISASYEIAQRVEGAQMPRPTSILAFAPSGRQG